MSITLPARASTERDRNMLRAITKAATRRRVEAKRVTSTRTTRDTKTRKATNRTTHITKNTARKEASTEDRNMDSRAAVVMEVAAEAEVMEEEEDMTVAIIRQKMRLLSV